VFKANNHKYSLIDIKKPASDYLILESLTLEKNTSRMVHLISPNSHIRSFRLGRGHDSDLRINDISVSRCHAVIKFKPDGFYIQDNMSKFGTLVLLRHRLDLSAHVTKAVQVGRTVVNFQLKPSAPPEYQIGEYILSRKKLSEQEKQKEELKKLLVNMS
jgi:pSer/pThr/pTyr-binding forkhead associated (FHA) protein